MRFSATLGRALLLALILLVLPVPRFVAEVRASDAADTAPLNVQHFLDDQPGVLKGWSDGDTSAAEIIQSYASYYSLDPRIVLTLLELDKQLLSDAHPEPESLRKPLSAAGPEGFAEQIPWAVREIRAGFGPYEQPPELSFSDGSTTTLDLAQEPSTVAVQRFLAIGRSQNDWRKLVDQYLPVFRKLWNEAPQAPTPTPVASWPFLKLPWPRGTEVIHSSYFDHVYPTVDRGADGNSFIVDYLGRGNLSYNTHDGHDYYFPDKPIGTPMLAAAPGTAYAYTARGNGVVIRHAGEYAGYETVYWHLDQFASIFRGKIDNGAGVAVQAGAVLGSSGKSGFTDGGAHLHFEVRHNGRQVDPYGWYGPGADPCAKWKAGCEASVWLWHDSVRGVLDLTRPGSPAPEDTQPPSGSLAVAPDSDLGLLVPFDDSIVPLIGKGFPVLNTERGVKPAWQAGVFEKAIQTPNPVQVTYPISGNVELERGTIALWAKLPQQYPANSTERHYLFAASANPEDGEVYTDTLALRREVAPGGARWNFWTVDGDGKAHDLVVDDDLSRDWHHFAISWDRQAKSKALFIDGEQVAVASKVAALPASLGDRLQLGRFIATFGASNAVFDELAVFRRALGQAEIARLAAKQDPYTGRPGPIRAAAVVTERSILLDSNAIDAQGGIVSVQLRRDNEAWTAPQPYYDSFRWTISGPEGEHSFAIKYRDRADNETVVSTTLTLAPPLEGSATIRSSREDRVVLGLEVAQPEQAGDEQDVQAADTDAQHNDAAAAEEPSEPEIMMQLSSYEDFRDGVWEPFAEARVWNWPDEGERVVWARFRDAQGRISAPLKVSANT